MLPERKVICRIRRRGPTAEEAARLDEIRKQVKDEFPPRDPPQLQLASYGVAAQVREARIAQGLSWSALAELAGISGSNTVRDIEYGRDVKVSDLQSVASALGLQLELVPVGA